MQLDTEKVKREMDRLNLSKKTLAERMNRSRQLVYNLFKGHGHNIETINDLAKALHLDPKDLLR